jgi:hypothetical protein
MDPGLIFMLAELSLGFGFSINVEAFRVSSHGVFSSTWMGGRVVFGLGLLFRLFVWGLVPVVSVLVRFSVN